jgi:hypothetical protein
VPLGNATGSCVGFTITESSITVALLPLAIAAVCGVFLLARVYG